MKDYGEGLVLILIICLFVKHNHGRDKQGESKLLVWDESER